MKKTCTTLALAALAGLVLARPAAAQPKPQTFNPVDVKAALKKAVDTQLIDFGKQFPHLTLVNPCTTEFNDAVKAAKAEHTACLDTNNPPAGSPLATFNALSNAALGQKCAGQTLDQCVAGVVKDQAKFCLKEQAKDVAKAKTVLSKCCGPLSQKKAELQKELAAVEADLKSCLGH